ncbi:MAG: ABC transporter ATP-binding protein, partial [Lachnospiraceae bacterium]|nr:ABC transporter ATP-binding protein [Lachnospiraceae bacterium]
MLQIQSISKQYVTGDLVQKALDGVSLNLRDNEFVAILGPSGSGKTTLLNIIGGLDRYDSGDLVINGISTKRYKDRDWDSYRNHTIGFVFQSYNLIPHQSILANVELALTISGVSRSERKARAKQALERVGLGDQLHKRPNQMSGGQMQRVAIARALVNDPDILLADEPTGALNTDTSIQVMDLLKEVAKDKLVVMVTHNPELAEQYATRIVKLRDGKIKDDSDPFTVDTSAMQPPEHKNMGKASMSFLTALSLSFNNLWTKKGRTTLTAFAGSIGIIGIALILSLSNGVNTYINDIQKSTMTSYPITIEERAFDLTSLLQTATERRDAMAGKTEPEHDKDAIYSNGAEFEMASSVTGSISENNLTDFKKYLDAEDSEIRKYVGENGIVYSYDISFDVYTYAPDGTLMNTDGKVVEMEKDPSTSLSISTGNSSYSMYASMFSGNNELFSEIVPGRDGDQVSPAVDAYYEKITGEWPQAYNEVVLIADRRNELSVSSLYQLGLYDIEDYEQLQKDVNDGKKIKFESGRYTYEDILGKELYLVPKCDYYVEDEANEGIYRYEGKNGPKVAELVEQAPVKLKITGIVRPKENAKGISIRTTMGYTNALTRYLIDYTDKSPVVTAQKADPAIDVTSGLEFSIPDDEAKASNAIRFVETLSNADKAIVFQSIMSEFST